MRSVELFTGAGGLAMGFSKAGFRHEAVLEVDQYACDTIRVNALRNHPLVHKWRVIQGRVENFDFTNIDKPVDLVAGGPPCQPFSLGGKHRAFLDSRDMFPQAARAVRELAPSAFVFENVKGLTRQSFASYFSYIILILSYPEITIKKNETWEQHLSRLERYHTKGYRSGLTYNVVARVLNAADYGVPQRRERVFIVGFRSDVGQKWSFPGATHSEFALQHAQFVSGEYWETHGVPRRLRPEVPQSTRIRLTQNHAKIPNMLRPWRTVRDSISDLPSPRTSNSCPMLNHRVIEGARIYNGHTGSPYDQPAKTLKAGVHGVPGGENIVVFPNGEYRYFTVREAARLQCFPDDYIFHGSWTECMRQLGNAVPVDLSTVIAQSVRSVIG
ncbi:MAG: DNA cytosine methyltransferase [Candidatus Hydrogenedentes bacterium]|nr:DNA cytosine methyltransferase [Candidatus Hydrogenedentota bacterium]